MRGDLRLVGAVLELAGRVRRTIVENLFWAFLFNVIGMPLAAFGYLSPEFAGAAMALSSVMVIGNALRLGRWRPAADIGDIDGDVGSRVDVDDRPAIGGVTRAVTGLNRKVVFTVQAGGNFERQGRRHQINQPIHPVGAPTGQFHIVIPPPARSA